MNDPCVECEYKDTCDCESDCLKMTEQNAERDSLRVTTIMRVAFALGCDPRELVP